MGEGWRSGADGSSTDGGRGRRRVPLATQPSPAPRRDFLVRWSASLPDGSRVDIACVPDRRVPAPGAVAALLEAAGTRPWPLLETLTLALLEDLCDALVPRWVRVAGERQEDGVRHRAEAEDRQPDWADAGQIRPARP